MLFKGVATALVTPMTEDGINYDKLSELVDWQIEQGINAIVLLGTTGEAPTISLEEKAKIIDRDFDVMLECKMKDEALYKLSKDIKRIKPEYEWVDESTFVVKK